MVILSFAANSVYNLVQSVSNINLSNPILSSDTHIVFSTPLVTDPTTELLEPISTRIENPKVKRLMNLVREDQYDFDLLIGRIKKDFVNGAKILQSNWKIGTSATVLLLSAIYKDPHALFLLCVPSLLCLPPILKMIERKIEIHSLRNIVKPDNIETYIVNIKRTADADEWLPCPSI